MKKIYLPLLTLLLLPAALRAQQTYTHGDLTVVQVPSMQHDTNTCSSHCFLTYQITVLNSFTGDSVKVVDVSNATLISVHGNTSGQNPWHLTVPIPIFNPVVTDDQLAGNMAGFFGPAVKVYSGPDTINNINNLFFLPVPNPCQYGNVSGRVFVDNNNDCVYNSGDVPLTPIEVGSQMALNSPAMTSLGTNGYSDTGGQYHLTIQKSWLVNYSVFLPANYQFIFGAPSCAPGSYQFTTVPQTNVNFPLQCTSNIDVQVGAGTNGLVRPLVPFFLHPWVSNTGCNPASGQLKLIKDSRVTYSAALSTNPATSVSGDTLTWSYANLSNLSNGAYWNSFFSGVHLTPISSVNIGDTLCFRVTANVPAGDVNGANNTYSFCLPVVASYDPNMKEVAPRGTGTAGNIPVSTTELRYTVHFQNTGTATAYNVSIVDSLDADIAAGSVRILGASHVAEPRWLAPGVVKFSFNNIFLPDSNANEPASHGFITFTVKLKSGLPLGTQIRNKAHIYFDTNPAVITNTTLNTIAQGVGVASVTGGDEVQLYPNPAKDNLYIRNAAGYWAKGGKVTVQNMAGQTLLTKELHQPVETVETGSLPAGMYLIRIVSEQLTLTKPFIRE